MHLYPVESCKFAKKHKMIHKLVYLSYDNNDLSLKQRSEKIVNRFFKEQNFQWSPETENILFIASGGS